MNSSGSSTPDTKSSRKVGSEKRRKGTFRAWKRAQKLEKLKEGGRNVTFLSYDGAYGNTDKVQGFIQQFDAAFGGESFTESSKLRHVAMYLQKSARQWWASLRTQGLAPRTWKDCRLAIMTQFLTENAKDDVVTSWRGLKLDKGEPIQKYVDKFWDLHLKAIVFKKIDFVEKKKQYCAGLLEDMKTYVIAQKPKTISKVIHHAMVAKKIFFANSASSCNTAYWCSRWLSDRFLG